MADLRTLFVEDSENDALLLLHELQKGGYDVQWERVETAADTRSALERQLWDLILCDFSMPSMNAMQALEILQNSGLDIPFIIVSGAIEEEAAVSALKAGAHDFLIKNNLARLLPAIRRELHEVEERREHKQTNDNLRASELRFRSTLESMMEGCQIIGFDWRYRYLNDAAVKQNQLTREALLGHTMMECNPGIEKSAMFATLRQCMEERTSQHMVNEFIYPDGSRGWSELTVQPAPDGIFVLSSDITKRRQAEHALLEREMKLSMLLDILPVGVSMLDAERQISYMNPAVRKMFDISEESLRNGSYAARKYLKADGTPMPLEELASALALREQRAINSLETGVIKEDDSIVWTSLSAVPVDFPDWKVVMVASDITERKQAELALRESEDRYRRLFENMHETLIIQEVVKDDAGKPVDLRFLDINPAAERAMGKARNEIVGQTRSQLTGQADPEGVEMASVVASTGRPFHLVRQSPGFGGWFESYTYPLGSGITATLALDITEQKQAESEILRLYAELEEKVAERTAELAAANEKLQKLSLFDELTGLYNRRGFLLLAEEQLALMRRTKRNMLVFYADLDQLKQINDGSGHVAGDQAIIKAAQALRETFRTSDIKARLGGDEFIVLAVEAEERSAQILLARLRDRLSEKNQSMSVGVVTCDAHHETSIDDLITRADEAMYAEKRSKPGHRE